VAGRFVVAASASGFVRFFDAKDESWPRRVARAAERRFRSIGRVWIVSGDTVIAASIRDARIHHARR
jgi:hypothetical protein